MPLVYKPLKAKNYIWCKKKNRGQIRTLNIYNNPLTVIVNFILNYYFFNSILPIYFAVLLSMHIFIHPSILIHPFIHPSIVIRGLSSSSYGNPIVFALLINLHIFLPAIKVRLRPKLCELCTNPLEDWSGVSDWPRAPELTHVRWRYYEAVHILSHISGIVGGTSDIPV